MQLPFDWREASRWWSLRVSALGTILFAAMTLIPDQLLALWNMMPAEVRAMVPARAHSWIGMLLFLAVILVRLIPQRPAGERQSLLGSTRGAVTPKAAGAGAVTGLVAIALTVAVAGLRTDEGKRNVSYLDIARVPTSCFGHTGADVVVGQYRTDVQCELLLRADATEHMMGALGCSPELATRPNQLAAVTRLTFNIGVRGYCRSSIQRQFAAGRWREGCDRFLAFRYAGGREVRGLLLRRQRERALCLTGLAA